MRPFLSVLLFGAIASAQQAEAPLKARVSGRVVNQGGDPVRRATVKLVGKDTYSQITDANGLFVVEGVAAGSYSLAAARTGFSAQKFGATNPLIRDCPTAEQIVDAGLNPAGLLNLQQCIARAPGTILTLAAGQELKDLTLKIMQQGSISGRLTNQDGEPVPNWQVQAMKMVYDHGTRQLQAGFGQRTDPDGNFTIGNLAPGRYYLHALDLTAQMFAGLNADRPGKASPEHDLETYYPSEADESRSTPVDITPGAELRGMDIRVRRGRVFSIRGSITAPSDGGTLTDQILTLGPKGAATTILNQVQGRVRADGSFEFRNITPGTYILSGGQAFGNAGAAPPLFGLPTEVTIASADVEGVALSLGPGIDITGTLTMEGGRSDKWPTVALRELESGRGVMSAAPDSNGAFRFARKMGATQYLVNLFQVPPGTYVKSIRFGRQDGIHSPLDLAGGNGGSLDIVISSKVAAVTGTVKNAQGAASAGAVVTLWPRVPEMTGGVKSASTDQDGKFVIEDLGPGDYFAAAWEDIDPGLAQDVAFMGRFQGDTSAVRVDEGNRSSTNVKLIPRERTAAEMAKIR